jgi:hypothetical protein
VAIYKNSVQIESTGPLKKKTDVSNCGINLQKIILNSPITIICQCSLLLNSPIRLKRFFAGFKGVLWVWIMGIR